MKLTSKPPSDVEVLGIPYDADSSYLLGCRKGPMAIREAAVCSSSNQVSESGIDLHKHPRVKDLGDLQFPDSSDPRQLIEQTVTESLKRGVRLLCLGGDHSITFPILKSHAKVFGPLTVLQLDAHPDLYDELDKNRFSHACPFARAHELGLIERHVQIGIRTLTPHQKTQAEKFGVEIADTFGKNFIRSFDFSGPIYVTLDLDVLDPAFAPGINHYEPGGLSTREVLNILHELNAPLIGADIVELNPERDTQQMTARVAAKFMKELLAKMLEDR